MPDFNNNDSIHSVYVRSRRTAATPPPYSSYTEGENIVQLPSLKLICFTHRGFYRHRLVLQLVYFEGVSGRLTGVTSQYGGIFTRARNRPDALGASGKFVIILPEMSGKREIIPVTKNISVRRECRLYNRSL